MRVRDREGRGGKRRKNGSELREARNMFYSWKFCMRHDLSMIYHSPAPALALYYFLSLNHLLFPHFSHSRSGATFSLGLLLLCWPQREINHQCWNGSSDGFWVMRTMWEYGYEDGDMATCCFLVWKYILLVCSPNDLLWRDKKPWE